MRLQRAVGRFRGMLLTSNANVKTQKAKAGMNGIFAEDIARQSIRSGTVILGVS